MRTAVLDDGTEVFCLNKPEALVLDEHVNGYLQHGITIANDDVIFDVGANIGVFAVRAMQRHPSVRVYAFEPIPDIYAVLAKNGQRYGAERFFSFRCGLSNAASTMTFDYYPRAPAMSTAFPEAWERDAKSLENAVRGNVRNARRRFWYAYLVPDFAAKFVMNFLRSGAKRVTSPLRTVSEIIQETGVSKIDLLKIDCEGAELLVLEGISDAHWSSIRQIVVEVHDENGRLEKLTALLRSRGFTKLTVVHEEGFEHTALRNVFALREGT